MQTVIDKLLARLAIEREAGNVVNLIYVFAALTADIIVQYTFAKPYGFIDDPQFARVWHKGMMDVSEGSHMFKQFSLIEPTMRRIPQSIASVMSPQLGALFMLGKVWQLLRD